MKVAELTAFQVRIPLRKPIRHASHTRTSTDNVIVRCVLADGSEGFGEGVPREYVTGETIDSSLALLRSSGVAAQLEPCRTFAEAIALAERLQTVPVPGDNRGCQGNAARCALELAILDAYGRHFGEPLSAVTAYLAADIYEPHPWVRYSGAITSARGGFKVRMAAARLWVYGFRQVKVKVGIADYDDVQRLHNIRRRLGWKVDVRVDANEAWPAEQAVDRIRALQPFAVSSIEQPVPHAEVDALADVRRQTGARIMLDESLCSRTDAERAIEGQTCDLFNIRLSKCGGYVPALRLMQLARTHGLGCQLGCQVGESAVLSAAGRHFACSVASLCYLEGSYDRHLVREALGTKDLTFGWGGWAPALAGPGLGIDLEPAALERVTLRKESLVG